MKILSNRAEHFCTLDKSGLLMKKITNFEWWYIWHNCEISKDNAVQNFSVGGLNQHIDPKNMARKIKLHIRLLPAHLKSTTTPLSLFLVIYIQQNHKHKFNNFFLFRGGGFTFISTSFVLLFNMGILAGLYSSLLLQGMRGRIRRTIFACFSNICPLHHTSKQKQQHQSHMRNGPHLSSVSAYASDRMPKIINTQQNKPRTAQLWLCCFEK